MTVHQIKPLAGLPSCAQCGTQRWTRSEYRPDATTYTEISPDGIGDPVTEEAWEGRAMGHQCENGHAASAQANNELAGVSAALTTRGMVGSRPGGAQIWPFEGGNCIGNAWTDDELRAELQRLAGSGVDLEQVEVAFLDGQDEVAATYRGPQVTAWLRGELPSPTYYQSTIG